MLCHLRDIGCTEEELNVWRQIQDPRWKGREVNALSQTSRTSAGGLTWRQFCGSFNLWAGIYDVQSQNNSNLQRNWIFCEKLGGGSRKVWKMFRRHFWMPLKRENPPFSRRKNSLQLWFLLRAQATALRSLNKAIFVRDEKSRVPKSLRPRACFSYFGFC